MEWMEQQQQEAEEQKTLTDTEKIRKRKQKERKMYWEYGHWRAYYVLYKIAKFARMKSGVYN